ncbi:hypothetical protein GP486_005941 [Trichoglossum hirsutum]|uniref:Uncharacterized protein n=1 Tax=Trichoglossum hirsutum TaxID=265104 RepID=A0A9P8L8C7_9PEZI|nr:hypothetical protein GP486_005941 [Trichoglossum hirsutum]
MPPNLVPPPEGAFPTYKELFHSFKTMLRLMAMQSLLVGRQIPQADDGRRRRQVLEVDLAGRRQLAKKAGLGGRPGRNTALASSGGRQHMEKATGSSKQLMGKAPSDDGQQMENQPAAIAGSK